jgi:hypothetical protein
MRRLLIFVFLISFGYLVYHVIRILIRYRLTENFVSDTGGNPMFMLDETIKPVNNPALDSRDAHYFLTTSVIPGKKDIVNLRESNRHKTNFYYVDGDENDKDSGVYTEITDPLVVKHRPSKLEYARIKDQLTCIPKNHPLNNVIAHHQPYMWEKPNIINYYDTPYYRDWRYPLQPIDVRFAANPAKYCEQFPMAYPCADYYSKW